jgi:gelsolin
VSSSHRISGVDLHGLPVQYREAQGYESALFLSYFPHFVTLKGGISTGFHHISAPPPLDLHKLYRITLSRFGTRSTLVVREVLAEGSSLIAGDVYVLDKGREVWQFNTKASAGQERFRAAEFVQKLVSERKGQCNLTVYGALLASL